MPRKPRAQRTPEENWQIELEGPETELLKTCLVVQEDDVVRPVLLVVYGHVVTFSPNVLTLGVHRVVVWVHQDSMFSLRLGWHSSPWLN
jgi:hypothetical protein